MLTIGTFSKLSCISTRMLRHYDRIGLLSPSHIGENGYRYYDPAQLAVLRQVDALKGYGFSLQEIKQLLPLPEAALAEAIHAQRLKTYEQLHRLKKTIRRMEEDIKRMEGTEFMKEKYHVIVMAMPEQKVFGIRKTINISQTHELFQELKEEMKHRGIKRTGPTQQRFLGETFDYDAMDIEAQAEVMEMADGVHVIPSGDFVATTHIGPYEEIHNAYEAIGAWMKEHPEYEVCGPSIERYLKDEESADSPEDLETGVLFPVKKVK